MALIPSENGRRHGRRKRPGGTRLRSGRRMKKEMYNRTSRSGTREATCGTKSRNKIWLPERRIEESDYEETLEDGAHTGWGGDRHCERLGLCANAERVLRFRQCRYLATGSGASIHRGREV